MDVITIYVLGDATASEVMREVEEGWRGDAQEGIILLHLTMHFGAVKPSERIYPRHARSGTGVILKLRQELGN